MTFSLFQFNLRRNAQSWIDILSINDRSLFYLEWDYDRKIRLFQIVYVRVL